VKYTVQEQLKPKGLDGISDDQIEQHWGLYKGYVTNVNGLSEELGKLEVGSRAWSELKRRAGFEWSGMVLHELYFGNLVAGGTMPKSGAFIKALEAQWGSVDTWRTDFVKTGGTRGIGWAIVYHDPIGNRLLNWWVNEHEDNQAPCTNPILIMDVFEHAFMVDYGASGRPKYIDAFMDNVNWDVVERRFADSRAGKFVRRY
jgi:Fe-Mn family superoxide dismutase